jgi:hypothetical protein
MAPKKDNTQSLRLRQQIDEELRAFAIKQQELERNLLAYQSGGTKEGEKIDKKLKQELEEQERELRELRKKKPLNEEQSEFINKMSAAVSEQKAVVGLSENLSNIPTTEKFQESIKPVDAELKNIRENFRDLHSNKGQISHEQRAQELSDIGSKLDEAEQKINKSLAEVQGYKAQVMSEAKKAGISIEKMHTESFWRSASPAARLLGDKMIQVNNMEVALSGQKQDLDSYKANHAEQVKNLWTPEKEKAWSAAFLKSNEFARMIPATTDKRDEQGNIIYAPNPEAHDKSMKSIMTDAIKRWKETGNAPASVEEAQKQVTMTPKPDSASLQIDAKNVEAAANRFQSPTSAPTPKPSPVNDVDDDEAPKASI